MVKKLNCRGEVVNEKTKGTNKKHLIKRMVEVHEESAHDQEIDESEEVETEEKTDHFHSFSQSGRLFLWRFLL